tara:strand:- start:2166 stop:2552 length:387 start_codon:yes stop_codon:yes gene_type:complete
MIFFCKECSNGNEAIGKKAGDVIKCKVCNSDMTLTSDMFSNYKEINRAKFLNGKYPNLYLTSIFIKYASIFSLIGSIVLFLMSAKNGSYILRFGSFLVGLISCVYMYAFSELIKLFIDIEKNTRKSND